MNGPPRAKTRGEAVAELRRMFDDAGLPSPALDARVLASEAAKLDPIAFLTHPDAPLEAEVVERIAEFGQRRLARQPVARITGWSEFWGLPFRLSPETLVPRPDTETVVGAALDRVKDKAAPLQLLDFGTGTGCLLVALLTELPRASGVGVDRSLGALATARANGFRNGVGGRAQFVASDWGAAIAGQFDIVVSNPPYLSTSDVARLDPEVARFDPELALDGGPDGLWAFRQVISDAKRLLKPSGLMVLEIGYDQADAVSDLATAGGLNVLEIRSDLGGHPRALVASAN